MGNAALQLDSVTRFYMQGGRRLSVLLELELVVQAGEFVALVAPSGSGKSTLLHIAGLLEKPNSGEVILAGAACSSLSDLERTYLRRRDIGFIYQFHHLLADFSAVENVMLPMMISGIPRAVARERASALLEYMGLAERAAHRPGELSGGEQQRVAVARSLANAPRLLLADEPTGNLDPITSKQVFDTLRSIVRATGLAMLVATHNRELADQADARYTFAVGKLRTVGPPGLDGS